MVIIKKISKILSGNLFAQGLAFVLYPLFARLYSPVEFGLYGLFTTICILMSIFVSGQYFMGAANPDDEEEATGLVSLSPILSLVGSAILTLIIGWPLVHLGILNLPVLLLAVIPLYIFVYISNESLRMFMVRHEKFGTSAGLLVLNRGVASGGKILMFKAGSLGLVCSDILANLLSALSTIRVIKFRPIFKVSYLKNVASKYVTFPTFFVVCIFFQQLIFELPVLILDQLYSKEELGYFVLLNKVTQQPVWMLAGVISTALLKDFVTSRSHSNKERSLFLRKVLFYCFLLSLLGAIVLFFLGSPIFNLLFPQTWKEVSELIPYTVVLIVSRFCSATYLCFLLAQNKLSHAALFRGLHCLLLASSSFFFPNEFHTFVSYWLILDGAIELCLVAIGITFMPKDEA